MKTIQNYITEIDEKADMYNNLEIPEARKCYEQYILSIIDSSLFNKDIKKNLIKYWRKLI